MCMNIMKIAVEYCEQRPSTVPVESQNTQDNHGMLFSLVLGHRKGESQFHRANYLLFHKNNSIS